MPDTSQSILDKISEAQTVSGLPPTEPMVPYRNIGELLELQADRYEDKPFLIYYSDDAQRKEFSYRDFYEETCKAANLLLSYGIGSGDRIATVSFNHYDAVVQYYAAFIIGAVVVPINVGEDDRHILYILENAGCKLVFVRDQFLERIEGLAKQLPHLKFVVQVGKRMNSRTPHYQSELAKFPSSIKLAQAPNLQDEALIVYTSGTTGLPKGVVLVQHNLLADAMAIAEWHRLSEDQRIMCVLPIHHVNGVVVTLMTPLYCGGGVVLNQKFHAEKFFERISIEMVNVVSVVPTILQFLLHANVNISSYKLGHLRHIICGAGPLTVELALRFEHEFMIPVIHGYGLSETTCYSSFLPIDLQRGEHKMWLSKHGFPSIGVPLPVNDMAIHDENGNELDEGQRGEIVIRGHNVMKHYFRNDEANEKTFAHGWFRSGDEGFFLYDEQGRKFFFITGRLKELIIRGGVNISPFEIDEVLMTIPGIQMGIAVGFENDWYGEEVGALVKLRDGILMHEEEVLIHCRKHLPFAKSPKVVVFGNDIPVTSTGKYQRNKCKEMFASWKSMQFSERRT
ncbi:MAG: class I adenylate-forming enzyme family protein [Bacteroidota bacterium]